LGFNVFIYYTSKKQEKQAACFNALLRRNERCLLSSKRSDCAEKISRWGEAGLTIYSSR